MILYPAIDMLDGQAVRLRQGKRDDVTIYGNPVELAAAEELLQKRRNAAILASGVVMHGLSGIRISPLSVVEPGAEIYGPCEICGSSVIKSGARIRSHGVIRDAVIDGGVEIREFCHIEGAEVRSGAIVGPYARLRPQALVDEKAHVGNFVELKKTYLARVPIGCTGCRYCVPCPNDVFIPSVFHSYNENAMLGQNWKHSWKSRSTSTSTSSSLRSKMPS